MEFQLSPSTETFLLSRQSSRRCREILESCPRGQRLPHSEQTTRLTCSGRRSPFQNERLRAIWDGVACGISFALPRAGPRPSLGCEGAHLPIAAISTRCLEARYMNGLDYDIGRSQLCYERLNC